MVKIAILGHGVVGSGVAEVLQTNYDSIVRKAGQDLEVKYILDLRKFPDLPYADKFVTDYEVILRDPEVEIVAEMLGGLHPAYDFARDALKAGKSVVTSNKEVVATKGAELLKLARENNVRYLFEASVGGGIPIIRPLHNCLAANEITEIEGILNGTTNYILTRMVKAGKTFEEALKEAQQKGYAEANPDADIQGIDTCRKICILSDLVYGKHVPPEKIHTEGITKVTLEDVAYAQKWGAAVKLVGRCKRAEDGRLEIMVVPCLVKEDSPLYSVEDVFNAITVWGNAIGDVMFYGRGAGKMPTASAVVADIIDIVKNHSPKNGAFWQETEEEFLKPFDQCEDQFFVRLRGERDSVRDAAALFGETEEINAKLNGELGFVTGRMQERRFAQLLHTIDEKREDVQVISYLRVLA